MINPINCTGIICTKGMLFKQLIFKQDINIKIRKCGMNANETTFHQSSNEVDKMSRLQKCSRRILTKAVVNCPKKSISLFCTHMFTNV